MIPHVFDERAAMQSVADMTEGSPECAWHRAVGEVVASDITIAGTGGAVTTNVFAFTGNVELLGIWGVFTDVTEVTTITGAYIDVYDGTNQVDLTDDGGVVLSAAVNGSMAIKTNTSAGALVFLKGDQVRIDETAADKRQFVGAVLDGKAATTNYVRLIVTTDANTDCAMRWYAAWRCLCSGSTLTAA